MNESPKFSLKILFFLRAALLSKFVRLVTPLEENLIFKRQHLQILIDASSQDSMSRVWENFKLPALIAFVHFGHNLSRIGKENYLAKKKIRVNKFVVPLESREFERKKKKKKYIYIYIYILYIYIRTVNGTRTIERTFYQRDATKFRPAVRPPPSFARFCETRISSVYI